MKKMLSFSMILVLLTMCGCTVRENTDTRFLLDTVVTLTADCDDDILEEAFSLCGDFEKLLSRTVGGSDISRLNSSNEFIKVSPNTEKIIERSLYYSEKTQGKFDITVCAVSK
ncbi:MAG: FAD:protein FMN transferase, partial [Acutalibacteraceae bacterium]|nr:FAD:protein FMN transferase [Acutalibacteraceae bacterium]